MQRYDMLGVIVLPNQRPARAGLYFPAVYFFDIQTCLFLYFHIHPMANKLFVAHANLNMSMLVYGTQASMI